MTPLENLLNGMKKYNQRQKGKLVNQYLNYSKYLMLTDELASEFRTITKSNPNLAKFGEILEPEATSEVLHKILQNDFDFNQDAVFKVKLGFQHSNLYMTVHGTTITSLGEYFPGLAYMILQPNRDQLQHYTVAFTSSFMRKLPIDESLYVRIKFVRKGFKMIFANFEIYDSKFQICSQGTSVAKVSRLGSRSKAKANATKIKL